VDYSLKNIALGLLLAILACTAPRGWAQDVKQTLPLSVRGIDINLRLFSLFALPGEELSLGFYQTGTDGIALTLDERNVGTASADVWRFQAPTKTGLYALRAVHAASGRETRLNLLVMIPASRVKNNHLNSYRIDSYPKPRAKHSALYQPPGGFIEVTPALQRLQLSPHFQLRQFLCKQEAGFPKYLVMQERLLALLEQLVPVIREAGFPIKTLAPISGYRTPYYNRLIGNVPNSRHVFGDAYDWYVDTDGNGRMDDINGDGKLDGKDSRALFNLVDGFLARPASSIFVGGLGRYRPTASHGGFVHTDTRGYRARW
jgi:hypothetical protein